MAGKLEQDVIQISPGYSFEVIEMDWKLAFFTLAILMERGDTIGAEVYVNKVINYPTLKMVEK